jgi:hypothetical protein
MPSITHEELEKFQAVGPIVAETSGELARSSALHYEKRLKIQ